MKTSTKIFIALIIIILIIVGYEKLNPKQTTPVATAPTTHSLSYSCTEGSFKALYGDNNVTLTLSDGSSLVLPQAVSGSGVRYENDTYAFITKGNYGFLQKSGTTIYDNCVQSTEAAAGAGMQTFTDGSGTFSFTHLATLSVTGGDVGYTAQWRNNTQTLGLLLAQTTIPNSVQPKTNFAGATFTVGTSSDPAAMTSCLTATNGEVAKGTTKINGITYNTFSLGDAGAGNFYDTTSYRTMHNSQCYAIEYTIHSTNIGNYSPDQGISAFDQKSVTATLESMAQSFTFLQ